MDDVDREALSDWLDERPSYRELAEDEGLCDCERCAMVDHDPSSTDWEPAPSNLPRRYLDDTGDLPF